MKTAARFLPLVLSIFAAVLESPTALFATLESREHIFDISFPLEKNRGSYRQMWHDCRPSGSNCTRAHRAVDLHAPPGTPVYAVADGVIRWRQTSAASGWSPTSGSGYSLYIDAPSNEYRHFYGHFGPHIKGRENEAFAVNPATGTIWKVGDTVKRGQRLGWVGTSGATASGPHLHFEIRSLKSGLPLDDPGNDGIAGRDYGDPTARIGFFEYLRYDPYFSLLDAEAREDYPDGNPKIGDFVRVVGVNSALNMRGPEACDPPIAGKARPLGIVGRVIAGPASCPEITSRNLWKIQWEDCEVGWSSQLYLEVVPTGSISCPEAQVSVEISGKGSVALNPRKPSYPVGATLHLLAVAAADYEFSHWSGTASGNENPISLMVDGNLSVTAHFLRDYSAWERNNFTSSERAIPNFTAPENDPFGTGVANLAIYAFGLHVKTLDRALLPRIERHGENFSFVFAQPAHTEDVIYIVERSRDLSHWSPLSAQEAPRQIEEHPETGSRLVRIELVPDPAGTTDFVRLRLQRKS